MAVLVLLRDQFIGIFGAQGLVNLRVGVFRADKKPFGRRSARRLVVEKLNFAGAVRIAKNALGIVDAGVHKAHQHALSVQAHIGLLPNGANSRLLQARSA
ncbi:hypothetical protein SDC9_180866 [bioreactor metagenome]|uniref:Uncharacterized protein n=1 Tax=bioreactor metagenome TaxID=1076179 RepID=A0A645H3U9_9ZZZZ